MAFFGFVALFPKEHFLKYITCYISCTKMSKLYDTSSDYSDRINELDDLCGKNGWSYLSLVDTPSACFQIWGSECGEYYSIKVRLGDKETAFDTIFMCEEDVNLYNEIVFNVLPNCMGQVSDKEKLLCILQSLYPPTMTKAAC